ncbi:MAG: hypothetical protein NVSMB64_17390 [Candidatus Velthaea sp.]
MTDDQLAAVIAAASALLRANAPAPGPSVSAWKLAARLGPLDAPLARIAARSNSRWNAGARVRG